MLSRDQEGVETYLASGRLLAESFSAPNEYRMREVLLCVDGAVASFGRTEMVARQLGRDRAAEAIASGWSMEAALDRFNQGGLASLEMALEHLEEFRQSWPKRAKRSVDADPARVAAFEQGMRYELSQLELKPADVEKLVDRLSQATRVARQATPEALIDHIRSVITELIEARRGDDRGMVDNLPWWKIVAVAVFFAIAVWALIKCGWRWFGWSCTPNEALIYVLIAKAAALGYKLC